MSAVVKALCPSPATIEDVHAQLVKLDEEIVDCTASLAAGDASDEDLDALHKRRTRLERLIKGAETLAQRAAQKRIVDERKAKETKLEGLVAKIDAFDEFIEEEKQKSVEMHASLCERLREIHERMKANAGHVNEANALLRELGRDPTLSWLTIPQLLLRIQYAVDQGWHEREEDGGIATDACELVARMG